MTGEPMVSFDVRWGLLFLLMIGHGFPTVTLAADRWESPKLFAELEPDDDDTDSIFSTGDGLDGEMQPEDADRGGGFGDSDFSGTELEPGDETGNVDFSLPRNLPIEKTGSTIH